MAMRKLVIFTLLLCAAMPLVHDHTALGQWNPVQDTVDTAVSRVDVQTHADDSQCRGFELSLGSTDQCAVWMTPDELEAATNG